jgi:hypothetical protein
LSGWPIRSASRSHHQPAAATAGDCPQNSACRPHHPVGEQHAWRAADGTAGLSAHCALFCRVARKSGAVGHRAALVSHPQRGAAKISARPAIDPARTPAAGLNPPATVANQDENRRCVQGQLPNLGSIFSRANRARAIHSAIVPSLLFLVIGEEHQIATNLYRPTLRSPVSGLGHGR